VLRLASLIVLIAGGLALSHYVAPDQAILFVGCTVLLFMLPGLPVGFALFGTDVRSRPESLFFGGALGIGMSGYGALIVAANTGWSIRNILAVIVLLTLLTTLGTYRFWRAPLLIYTAPWDAADFVLLHCMAIGVLLFVAVPFLHVGAPTSQGFGFAWLFGLDFLVRGSYVSSLTMGFPLDYLYLTGMPLRMYMVGYVAPAYAYSLSGKSVGLHSTLLVMQIAFDLLFVACLFALLRNMVRNRRALIATSAIALAAYSYYSWFVALKDMGAWLPSTAATLVHKAVQAQEMNLVSHLLQRSMLVEPQAVLALSVFAFMIFLFETPVRSAYARAVIFGVSLSIEFGIDAWLGLVAVTWFGVATIISWISDRRGFGAKCMHLLTAAAVCGLITLGYFVAGVYEFGASRALHLAPNKWLLGIAPLYYLAELGPVFVLGIWGLAWQFKTNRSRISASLLVLTAVAMFQDLFVEVFTLPRMRIGNRLLPIIFLIFASYFLTALFTTERRRAVKVVAVVLVLAAVPTVATDIYGASDISNQALARFVAPSDMTACNWLKTNTPETAIIQSEPDYVGQRVTNGIDPMPIPLIADFAERRMIVGEEWVSRVVLLDSAAVAHQRYADVHLMFHATSVGEIANSVVKYGIDYIYVGQYEQRLYPQILPLMKSAPDLFEPVYSRDNTTVFRCNAAALRGVAEQREPNGLNRSTPSSDLGVNK
jgi:hypothetical protein